jgi:hypothetical protein
MYGSEIYNDFVKDIYWLRDKIQEESRSLPDSLKPLVEHYTRKRLIIIPTKSSSDSGRSFDFELGRPVPYATFWFADAFGVKNELTIRKLALGLVYSSLVTTIRDDVVDNELPFKPECFNLLNYYHHRYLEIFNEIFEEESKFWYYLAESLRDHAQYETWNLLYKYDPRTDPFSDAFLQESSRYFTAVVLPTLAALAIMTDNESDIPTVVKFLRNFSMGWRVYDDFCDWHLDLKNDNLNHSSILLYVLRNTNGKDRLNKDIVYNMFLNPNFIEGAYGAILGFFSVAQDTVSGLDCAYLTKFMDEQISFHTKRRDQILTLSSEANAEFFTQIEAILKR